MVTQLFPQVFLNWLTYERHDEEVRLTKENKLKKCYDMEGIMKIIRLASKSFADPVQFEVGYMVTTVMY